VTRIGRPSTANDLLGLARPKCPLFKRPSTVTPAVKFLSPMWLFAADLVVIVAVRRGTSARRRRTRGRHAGRFLLLCFRPRERGVGRRCRGSAGACNPRIARWSRRAGSHGTAHGRTRGRRGAVRRSHSKAALGRRGVCSRARLRPAEGLRSAPSFSSSGQQPVRRHARPHRPAHTRQIEARAVRPHREGRDGAGHPRAIFKRAIERGNVVVAEATAREVGRLSLEGRRSPLG
jgi:hypothetical protein